MDHASHVVSTGATVPQLKAVPVGQLMITGKWRDSETAETTDNLDPTTEAVTTQIAKGTVNDANADWAGMIRTVALIAALASATAVAAQTPDRVRIGAFALDRTEVTIGQFRAFARAAGLTTAAEREGGGFEFAGGWTRRTGWTYERPQGQQGSDNEPAVHISWHEASRYCAHAGGRLPSMMEWRSAAYTEQREQPADGFVKGRTYVYPVGDQPDGMNNNRRAHMAVGMTKRGVNGLYDMGANVWEWIADRRGDDALTAGGSWWYGPEQSRAEGVQWKAAGFLAVYVGFRCAYDIKG